MRENRWIKTEEGKTHLIILLLGIIGILLSIVLRENLSITAQDILLSISSSIVASAVVFFITAGYIAKRLTIKSQEVSEKNEQFSIAVPPPLTNSIQMLLKRMRGRRENSKQSSASPSQKRIAFECFGLSRVRCAGWLVSGAQAPREQDSFLGS